MSENQDTINDGSENTSPDEKPLQATPVVEPKPKPKPKPAEKPAKGSSGVAWLALLLAIGVAGAGIWFAMELQRREAGLNARLAEFGAAAAQEDNELAALEARWERQLGQEGNRTAQLFSEFGDQLQGIENRLVAQREELSRIGASDKEDWLLAEAQYLLRLANQRLIMADDVVAAKALLTSADSILVELQDVALHDVRAAVAADLAAVKAIPKRDTEGMYLVLAALIEQADKLVIFELPELDTRGPFEPAQDWQGRLVQGYKEALLKLSDYIIIRRRDVPIEALMDPQWEGLVRHNLRMLLEQAQVALLSGNQTLFRESLERASHWVAEFFQADEAAAKALAQEIALLKEKDISVAMPDISRSLVALDLAMERRAQRGGGE